MGEGFVLNKNLKNMIIVFLGFFISSLFSNTLSPFITTIKSDYGVSSSVIAMLPSIVYCGSFMICILGAKLMPVLGLKKGAIYASIIAIIASFVIIISKSYYVLIFGYFLTGIAYGMMVLFFSTMLSLLPKKYQKFSFANACFGFGGILILPVDRAIIKSGIRFNNTYIIHVILMILLVAIVFRMENIEPQHHHHHHHHHNGEGIFNVLKNPLILMLSFAIFFYVGSEISTTNWTGTFLEHHYGIGKVEVPSILSGFWILFTIGRAIGDKFLEKVGQLKFLTIAPIITIIGIFVVLSGKVKIQALIGMGIIGITIALIYPALQGYIVQHVEEENIPSASVIIVIFNNLGATVLTYIIGFAGGIKVDYVFIIQIFFYIYIVFVAGRYLFLKAKN